jgi:hypothetical protein
MTMIGVFEITYKYLKLNVEQIKKMRGFTSIYTPLGT